jgi:alkyl sulfatase BDS1-like metallo-beta-lactamase superfamily hydrolase
MGFDDGQQATLNPLPPEPASEERHRGHRSPVAVRQKAQADLDQGDYRWVAVVLRHVVFADPTHQAATAWLADADEQLGYQAESGPSVVQRTQSR